METTKLSNKGQVIIPKAFRASHQWRAGLELVATELGDGVLLRPKNLFQQSSLDQVAGALKYSRKTKSLDEIASAMKKAAKLSYCTVEKP